jgi:hypothetical protein
MAKTKMAKTKMAKTKMGEEHAQWLLGRVRGRVS